VVKATCLGEITVDKSWSSKLGVCREASSLTQENYLLKNSTRKRRKDDLGRPRHVKRIKKELIGIGIRNVNTMLKAEEMQEIADEIFGSQIQVVALQEIRGSGYGSLKKDKYSIYHNCNPSNTGHAGTGYIIQKSSMNKILGFEPISDRICKLRAKGKFYNMIIKCMCFNGR
jgi:hypothetical protein